MTVNPSPDYRKMMDTAYRAAVQRMRDGETDLRGRVVNDGCTLRAAVDAAVGALITGGYIKGVVR